MASIHHEITVETSVDRAWAALSAVGDAHTLFAPVLSEGVLNGDVRMVRFANGMVIHERILDVNDTTHRVAYTAIDGPGMSYHHASMQVIEAGSKQCRFVWITDFLPQELRATLQPLIEAGAKALKANLEAS
jgi:hypothetical protein